MKDSYLNSLLGENEQVLFVTHQHWLVLALEILSETVLTISLLVLVTLIWLVWLPNPLIVLAYLLLLFPLVSLWRDVLTWQSRKYVVTNWRVIQIAGIFNKDVTDSSLEKVNDVKLEQSIAGRWLNFGNIEILTASELGVNKFVQVARPINFKTAMLNAKEKLEHGQAAGRRSETNVVSLVAQLDNLRQQGLLTNAEFEQKKAQLLKKL